MLKTGDDMLIFEGMQSLNTQLQIAQDNTLTNFPLEHYMPVLIEILKRPPLSDISNDNNCKFKKNFRIGALISLTICIHIFLIETYTNVFYSIRDSMHDESA